MPHYTVVLVEPQIPANIGMVCRAMANFNVTQLRLVNPCNHLDTMARRLAVAAEPLLERARVFSSLGEALSDQLLSIAATRRPGRFRGELFDLGEFAPRLQQLPDTHQVALVFGREDSGLTRSEVESCHHSVTIRTSSELGSLNLAQATLLFLYELHRNPAIYQEESAENRAYPTQGDADMLCNQVGELLERIAFLNPQRPDAIMQPLRRLLHRAAPDLAELNLLRGMFSQLSASVNNWRGKRRGSS